VGKKQKNCDPANSSDDHKGDWWDHVAYDPEHRLVLAVVPGARSIENAEEIVATVRDRTNGVAPQLMTSDEYPAYTSAIGLAFGVPVTEPTTGPGRRPILPARRLPQGLTYATVHKQRQNDRVVGVERRLILGTEGGLEAALGASAVSQTVNTSFVERQHGTDRGQKDPELEKMDYLVEGVIGAPADASPELGHAIIEGVIAQTRLVLARLLENQRRAPQRPRGG